ncbi:MAG: HEAT repeat domain-containing protein [Synechococcales cyanobacterium RM1_1_8]|nr:HEAT repeat domain-containing protein [Synechococcales cyanobacterium RM1_1_8]
MDSDRLAQLEADLRNAPVNKCKEALDELATGPADQVVPMLQRIAQDGDFLRRRFAVMGLGNHRTEQSFAVLQQLLNQEQDGNVLGEIANSLFEFGDRAFPLLQQLFEQQTSWITRQSIIGMLMEGAGEGDRTLLAVVQLGLDDPEQSVVEASILALGKLLQGDCFEPALKLLEPLTRSEDWRSRWRAATALGVSDRAEARALLLPLQQDSHHRVVAAALEGSLP